MCVCVCVCLFLFVGPPSLHWSPRMETKGQSSFPGSSTDIIIGGSRALENGDTSEASVFAGGKQMALCKQAGPCAAIVPE